MSASRGGRTTAPGGPDRSGRAPCGTGPPPIGSAPAAIVVTSYTITMGIGAGIEAELHTPLIT